MTAVTDPAVMRVRSERHGLLGWLTTTDHKRIALMTLGTALTVFFAMGALAMTMRTQLARPDSHVLSERMYDELFTIHGSGMIYLAITPFAIGLGVYLVPLQVGAPVIAAPRTTLLGYWFYVGGILSMMSGFLTSSGAARSGWTAYTPLSDSQYSPGFGQDLWILGAFISSVGMILMAGAVLWTVLSMRAPGMTMLRVPVFSWSMIATCLMVLAAFPSLLVALGELSVGRIDPAVFTSNVWNVGFQHLFWFYAHPVVYVMFFPFVGAVAEVLQTFSGRRFFGYKATVLSLLAFAALSMSVWGHHMFATGQATNDYYSLTSILLIVPAGIEYFGMIATVIGGVLSYRTPMLFALAFIPQFLVGGLTGIMVATPVIDYHVTDSYFVVAHFHYTLLAGSVFGLFAGLYYWFPKATGIMLGERLGKTHFWLMVIGTNLTFLPMFWLGFEGMPRRVSTYFPGDGFSLPNLLSTCGAAVITISLFFFLANVVLSALHRRPAGNDPWHGNSLEWATTSPPPQVNFAGSYPLPPITGFAPLLDAREREQEQR